MSKLDWILFGFGMSGWVVACLSATYQAQLLRALSEVVIDMLKEERERQQ